MTKTITIVVIIIMLSFSACRNNQPSFHKTDEVLSRIESNWLDFLLTNFPGSFDAGNPPLRLPDISLRGAQFRAQKAGEFLEILKSVDYKSLSHQNRLTYDMIERQTKEIIEFPKYYYIQFDLTPYQFGFILSSTIPQYFSSINFNSSDDSALYLSRIDDLIHLVKQIETKVIEQMRREIVVPLQAFPGIRGTINNILSLGNMLAEIEPERLTKLPNSVSSKFRLDASIKIQRELKPVLNRLINMFGDDLENNESMVGLWHYPDGGSYYQYLIRLHTNLDLSPDEIHQLGIDRMATIQKEMQLIREEIGFEGTAQEFHANLKSDSSIYLNSPKEVESLYNEFINRIEPLINKYFSTLPNAPYGVKRLDKAMEAGMTYGLYQIPSADESRGLYRYNGSGLDKRSMIWAGSLIYHELIPGHHFQLALQYENQDLSNYRQRSWSTAYVEGWANYAANLAYEMGVFKTPLERYGHLLYASFTASRLVVDTGLNHLKWDLEEAKSYMLLNTFLGESEVDSELLRYSSSIPAQALAYELGYLHLLNLRNDMEAKYKESFNIKDFHEAVINSGTLSLIVLTKHVDWFLDLKYKSGNF